MGWHSCVDLCQVHLESYSIFPSRYHIRSRSCRFGSNFPTTWHCSDIDRQIEGISLGNFCSAFGPTCSCLVLCLAWNQPLLVFTDDHNVGNCWYHPLPLLLAQKRCNDIFKISPLHRAVPSWSIWVNESHKRLHPKTRINYRSFWNLLH